MKVGNGWRYGAWVWWVVFAMAFIVSGCATDGTGEQVTAEAEPGMSVSVAETDVFLGSRYGQNLTESDRIKQAEATVAAMSEGDGSATVDWTNPETGAKGTVSAGPTEGEVVMLELEAVDGIELINANYRAEVDSNVRARPTTQSPVVDGLRKGETFQAVGKAVGSDWILVARDGKALGFVYAELVASTQLTKMGDEPALSVFELTIRCRDVQREARTAGGGAYQEAGRYCTDIVNSWQPAG